MLNKFDHNSIDWATRNHPRRLYYRATEDAGAKTDGRQNVQVIKGRQVNPERSMCAGGTVVRGRSKKGKFIQKAFVFSNAKSDSRIDPAPVFYRQPDPMLVAPRHAGTPVKTVKHVPLRSKAGR